MKSVLIVEPDEALGALLEIILEEEGYATQIAHDLEEASSILPHTHFDAIITEAFDQGRLFSFDPGFLARLRASAGHTPIILCSTDTYALGVHAGDFGLAEVICKPLDVDDLPKQVQRVTGQR